jgi:hypothetical protein
MTNNIDKQKYDEKPKIVNNEKIVKLNGKFGFNDLQNNEIWYPVFASKTPNKAI